jgi:uncharacterized protein
MIVLISRIIHSETRSLKPSGNPVNCCFFASDLHGSRQRYESLRARILEEKPAAVFIGGDILPHPMDFSWRENKKQSDFIIDYLIPLFSGLKATIGLGYPKVFVILGNDDPRMFESSLEKGQDLQLWESMHFRSVPWEGFRVYGYSCIPPSPFQLKDWERYDVSRFVDPGCISPEEGSRTAGPSGREIRFTTIVEEIEELLRLEKDFSRTIFLSHCPPYGCNLDRADLDGISVDHAPLDVHIGSIAIQRFIQEKQPLLTLHGHVHESRKLTGQWKEKFGFTTAYSAANETPALALVRFDPRRPDEATLELI